ncbi:hypothetical protein CNEONATC25_02719 [Clostridium neonatale]|uniref:Uncharacterized protein n=1 Tax=Clostridium neonatale TaxID=137838 RepID=A0A650MJV2_9CLOT|nr:hypothetical protein CNEONATC25_02719 [Clostridium neonatale]SUQ50068.1 hypothetical protein CNEONATNEC32_02683 [Clostridium neonatale]SUQ51295.1 hypothetical protein CNEONATNEC26_02659 [Clostridium neonatale]VCT85091.1 hypothetical protein CNEONATNEC25_02692 [Clostridium neonatale]
MIFGFLAFNTSPLPVTVPPVPTPATKMSTFPSVSFQISSAVVFLCTSGLASFSNCCGIIAFPYSATNSSAFFIAPFIPSAPGVRTISAPNAATILLLSILIVSGIVRINLRPLAAATKASPIPVFPLVGSIITVSLFILPSLIPFSIIAFATLSLTLPSGLKYSSFAIIFASKPFFSS